MFVVSISTMVPSCVTLVCTNERHR